MTTTRDIADLLKALLAEAGECEDGDSVAIDEIDIESRLYECRAETFEERDILTADEGIVLSLADGSEFQITIVRSR